MAEAKIRVVVEGLPAGCERCGAVVGGDRRDVHDRWHERIEAVLASVEHADALAAELRERGDG